MPANNVRWAWWAAAAIIALGMVAAAAPRGDGAEATHDGATDPEAVRAVDAFLDCVLHGEPEVTCEALERRLDRTAQVEP